MAATNPIVAALLEALDDESRRDLAAQLAPHLADKAAEPVRLLSTREAADVLGIHPKTLVQAARHGRVPGAIRAGSRWRYDPSTLELHPVDPRAPGAAPHGSPSQQRRHTPAGDLLPGQAVRDALRGMRTAE